MKRWQKELIHWTIYTFLFVGLNLATDHWFPKLSFSVAATLGFVWGMYTEARYEKWREEKQLNEITKIISNN